jgi:hypothetical protein
MAQQLPLGRVARCGNNWNDPQLLPQLGDRSEDGCFGHFAAQGVLQAGDCVVACLKQFVSLHGELRNLARTGQLRTATPIAVSAQRIHVRQYPARHHKIRMLARLALKVQAHRNIGRFKADQ